MPLKLSMIIVCALSNLFIHANNIPSPIILQRAKSTETLDFSVSFGAEEIISSNDESDVNINASSSSYQTILSTLNDAKEIQTLKSVEPNLDNFTSEGYKIEMSPENNPVIVPTVQSTNWKMAQDPMSIESYYNSFLNFGNDEFIIDIQKEINRTSEEIEPNSEYQNVSRDLNLDLEDPEKPNVKKEFPTMYSQKGENYEAERNGVHFFLFNGVVGSKKSSTTG